MNVPRENGTCTILFKIFKLFFQPLKVFQNYQVKSKANLIHNQRDCWPIACYSMANVWVKIPVFLVSVHNTVIISLVWLIVILYCSSSSLSWNGWQPKTDGWCQILIGWQCEAKFLGTIASTTDERSQGSYGTNIDFS